MYDIYRKVSLVKRSSIVGAYLENLRHSEIQREFGRGIERQDLSRSIPIDWEMT